MLVMTTKRKFQIVSVYLIMYVFVCITCVQAYMDV